MLYELVPVERLISQFNTPRREAAADLKAYINFRRAYLYEYENVHYSIDTAITP